MTAARTTTRTGAILFTDLVGFTEFTDACGDAAAVELLDEQFAIATEALAGREGHLVKELGDGLMLWFDQVVHALHTAGGILDAIETARSERGFPLSLRMGMHCGEVVARGADFVDRPSTSRHESPISPDRASCWCPKRWSMPWAARLRPQCSDRSDRPG